MQTDHVSVCVARGYRRRSDALVGPVRVGRANKVGHERVEAFDAGRRGGTVRRKRGVVTRGRPAGFGNVNVAARHKKQIISALSRMNKGEGRVAYGSLGACAQTSTSNSCKGREIVSAVSPDASDS